MENESLENTIQETVDKINSLRSETQDLEAMLSGLRSLKGIKTRELYEGILKTFVYTMNEERYPYDFKYVSVYTNGYFLTKHQEEIVEEYVDLIYGNDYDVAFDYEIK